MPPRILPRLFAALVLIFVGTFASTAFGQGLSISSQISHPYIPANTHSDISATLQIEGGEPFGDDKRAPLNIALVIDRSTSMSGDKFVHAKKASQRLIEMLGPDDRLAIISYGSDVTVESDSRIANTANKAKMRQVVQRLKLRGGTNLSGGYLQGVDSISPFASGQTINRVILLSDGKANEGIVAIGQLGEIARKGLDQGITLSTLGIGLDFNEVLMTRMAREGAGNYYFVEDEKALAEIFVEEWGGLSSAIAKNATVRIELGPGVELKKLHGFTYSANRNTVTVPLAAFFAHQRKDILLELAVSSTALGSHEVADVRLTWTDPLNKTTESKRLGLKSTVTNDMALLKKVDGDVIARVEQLKVSDTLEKAMVAYDRGDKDEAVNLLRAQRTSMRETKAKYDFEDDGAFDRVEGELQDMEKTVEKSSSKSTEGKRLKKRARKRSYDVSQSVDLF